MSSQGLLFEIDEHDNDVFQNKKKRRIARLSGIIKKLKTVEKRKLLSLCSVKLGWAKNTTRYYLNDLQELGLLKEENGEIKWCKQEEENTDD
ncbi:MAG: hypothetical protein AM325_016545 [Candidatus Thorarchaeota archaeon SMTZ1-45]